MKVKALNIEEKYKIAKSIEKTSSVSKAHIIDYALISTPSNSIINIIGTLDSPVIIEDLKSGIYAVKGVYQISYAYDTLFSCSNNILFVVEHASDAIIKVIKIAGDNIDMYTISDVTIATSVASKQYVDDSIQQINIDNKIVDILMSNTVSNDEISSLFDLI